MLWPVFCIGFVLYLFCHAIMVVFNDFTLFQIAFSSQLHFQDDHE